MPSPKICIVTETYRPEIGGGETQARTLADTLASRHFPVIVLTRRSDRGLPKIEPSGDVIIHRLWPAGKGHIKKWGLLLSSIPALIRLRRQYDVILVCGFRVLGLAAVIAAKLLGKRCVLKADSLGEMSGEFFKAGLAKFGLRPSSIPVRLFLGFRDSIVRRADGFVAISAAVKTELKEARVHDASVHMIPNSVDTARFCPVNPHQKQALRDKLGLPLRPKIVTFTGRLVSYKGLPLLLRVWQQISRNRSNIMLLLIGSGSLDIHNCEAALKEFVGLNTMEETVWFVGKVENVHEYLQASDLFVFPTEREAFGISLIEAMACGLPVISTSTGGVGDIVQDRGNGLIVEPNDSHDLYQALDTLLSDRDLATALGEQARTTVEERYSEPSVTSQYLELFDRIQNRDSLKANG